MQVEVSLLHGRRGNSADGGVRFATGECQVTPDNIHDYWVRETGLIKICSPGFNLGNAEVKISLDELRTIIATLRKRGIEIDDERQMHREMARELWESLGPPREKLAETAVTAGSPPAARIAAP